LLIFCAIISYKILFHFDTMTTGRRIDY